MQTLQHTAAHRNTLQRTATHSNALQHSNTLQHIIVRWQDGGDAQNVHDNAMQNTATRCNTSHNTATHYNTLQNTATSYNTVSSDGKIEAPLKILTTTNRNTL